MVAVRKRLKTTGLHQTTLFWSVARLWYILNIDFAVSYGGYPVKNDQVKFSATLALGEIQSQTTTAAGNQQRMLVLASSGLWFWKVKGLLHD